LTTAKTTSRQQRGITLFRERGQEIVEVEPGVYRVPASEGGGFYWANLIQGGVGTRSGGK
jgi:hypothetical protein